MPATTRDEPTPAVVSDRTLDLGPHQIDQHSELMRRELAWRRAQIERAIEAARQRRARQGG